MGVLHRERLTRTSASSLPLERLAGVRDPVGHVVVGFGARDAGEDVADGVR